MKYLKILIFIGVAVIVGICAYKMAPTIVKYKYVNTEVIEKGSDKSELNIPTYAKETNYKGNDLIMDLYEIPFKKTNAYVMNKNLKLTEQQSREYMQFAKQVILAQYNVGYTDAMTDPDNFESKIIKDSYCVATSIDGADVMLEDYMRELENWLIDTHTSLKASFDTDKSLIYKDRSIFVRGQLTVGTYETDDVKKVAEYLELDKVKKGEEYKIPVEIEIVHSGNGMKFNSITFLHL